MLALGEGDEVALDGDAGIYLSVTHGYVVRDDEGTYAVATIDYTYNVDVDDLGGEALSYQ